MIKAKSKRKLIFIIGMQIVLLILVSIKQFDFSIINKELIYGLLVIIGILTSLYFLNDYEDFSIWESVRQKYYSILDYFGTFIFAILTLQIIYSFVIFPSVQLSSMVPTLKEGDRIVVLMGNKLQRFDIVVFEVDVDKLENVPLSEDNNLWVKRVIGLPGEKVAYINGLLYINDQLVEEPFLYDEDGIPYQGTYKTTLPEDLNGKVIPEGYYLFLGDNRAHSTDSRDIGLVPKFLVVGRGEYKINSLFDWQKIGDRK